MNNLKNIASKVLSAVYNFRIFKFIRGVTSELTQVDWLSRRLTIRYTILVIICLILGTLFVLGIDQLFIRIKAVIL